MAVVTGGGAGIGAGVAEALGRAGHHVVTLDPMVSLDGSARADAAVDTTATRIVAAGGSAEACDASVTDREAVRALFERLAAQHGRLDAVVNVAGISRPTSFADGDDADWRAVLEVHLDGYRNVLGAALPLMAEAGHGRVLGVTSGAGWRPGDAGAYGVAKRAVASLTWQLGRHPPEGVVVNAMSPIAMTRMVVAAIERAKAAPPTRAAASGGLGFGGMPKPEDVGPLAARLVADDLSWCSGQVVFAGGSEIAVVEPPQLLEVVRTDGVSSLACVLDAVVPRAFAPAEAAQVTGGGSNPRFAGLFEQPAPGDAPAAAATSCVVVTDVPVVGSALREALEARGIAVTTIDAAGVGPGFAAAGAAVRDAAARVGSADAVVVALAERGAHGGGADGWDGVLAAHDGLVDHLHRDAAWARAASDHAAAHGPTRLVTLTGAVGPGGRSRAQAVAQLARAARTATGDRVAAFAIALEADPRRVGAAAAGLVAHLLADAEAVSLSGAELVCGDGWVGLRSHPRPTGSVAFGGPELPRWFDDVLRRVVGAGEEPG